jgi:putative multicomponent Na+:H+ antiporter subunit B
MNDSYIYVITALLPLSAFMLVLQVNPYHALVIQGIVRAVAALVFAVLGADVALTQALIGTLFAITLYVIAVRLSLVRRLGVIGDCYKRWEVGELWWQHVFSINLSELPDNNLGVA